MLWIIVGCIAIVLLLIKFFVHGRTYGKYYEVDENQLTREPRFYKSVADQLESNMQGAGTNETEIIELIEGLNDAELRQVSNEFGYRQYMDFYLGRFGPFKIGTPSERADLFTWLMWEFSGSQKEYLRDRFIRSGIA